MLGWAYGFLKVVDRMFPFEHAIFIGCFRIVFSLSVAMNYCAIGVPKPCKTGILLLAAVHEKTCCNISG